MKSNKVSRTVIENTLINTRTIKDIKENNIDVYDKDGKRLDTTSIDGLTKAHVTLSRAYPYIYDTIHNILNDEKIHSFIDLESDKYFYKISLEFFDFIELSLGGKKNHYQKKYLMDELKTFKTENKIIIAKDTKNKTEKYIHAPTLFFVLDGKGENSKIIKSNLDNRKYMINMVITIYFSKPLFYEAVEKKNYSFFYIPKNMYANSKRLIEHLSVIKSGFFKADITVAQYTKSIHYLLAKNNKSNKKPIKKDGSTKLTPSIMHINLLDYARYVYPDAIIPNTNRLRHRQKLLSLIEESILIHNIILTQNKITNSTITLSHKITDCQTTNKKSDVMIPILEYSKIDFETTRTLYSLFYNNDLSNTIIYERTSNKNEFIKDLNNFKEIVNNVAEKYKQICIAKGEEPEPPKTDEPNQESTFRPIAVDMDDFNNLTEILAKLSQYL